MRAWMGSCMISPHPIDISRSEEERAVEVQYGRCLDSCSTRKMKGGKVGCGLGRKAGLPCWRLLLLLLLSGVVPSLLFPLCCTFFCFCGFCLHGIRRFGWDTFATLGGSYVPKRLELALLLYNTRAILHIYFVEMIRVRVYAAIMCALGRVTRTTVRTWYMCPYIGTLGPTLRRSCSMESAGGSAETPLPFGQQRQGFLGLAPAAGDVGACECGCECDGSFPCQAPEPSLIAPSKSSGVSFKSRQA
jgi:hypothetical protein